MNGNSRYSNVLTMLLIIFIVAIVGVIIYFVYDSLNSNRIQADAQTAIDEFERATRTVSRASANTNTVTEEVVNEVDDVDRTAALEALQQANADREDQTAEVQEAETKKVYMDSYEVIGEIEIPKTKCKYPILDSVAPEALAKSICKVAYGAGINKVGNTILYGHNYRNGLFFSNNKNLAIGDIIYLTDTSHEKVAYEIYNIYETEPSDASYFTRDTEGRREVSLQTCTDDGARRIIIWAKEKI